MTFFNESTRKGITPHLYNNIHAGIAAMYNNQMQSSKECLSSRPLECAFTPNNQHINI